MGGIDVSCFELIRIAFLILLQLLMLLLVPGLYEDKEIGPAVFHCTACATVGWVLTYLLG